MSAAVDRDVATPWLLALRPLWEAIRHHQYVSLRKLFLQSANKLVDGRVRLLGMTVAALEHVRGWSRAEMRAALADLERRVRPELVRVAAEMASHGKPLFASSSGRRPVPTLPAAQRSDWFDENGFPIELPSPPSTREGAHRRCSKERDCDRDGARQTEQQQVVFHALRTVITGELPATECDLLLHRVLEFVANMKTVPAGKETSYAALQKTVRGVASSAPRSVEILEGAHVFYGTRRHLARANPNAEEGPDASLRVLVLDPDELEHLSAALTQARWGPEDEPTATGEDFRQRFLDAYLGGWLAAAEADRGGSRSTGPNNVLILLRLLSGNRERQVEASDTGARAEKSVEKQLEDACQLDRIELILAALRRHEGVTVVTVVEEGEENGESELQPLLERVSPVTLFSSADFVARNTLRCARLRRLGDPALRRGGERGWWALEGLGVLTRSPPQEDAAFPSWLVVAGVEAADQEARVKKLLHYHRSFMEAEAQATVFIDGGLSLELQFLRHRRSGGSLRSPGFELARGAFLAVLEALARRPLPKGKMRLWCAFAWIVGACVAGVETIAAAEDAVPLLSAAFLQAMQDDTFGDDAELAEEGNTNSRATTVQAQHRSGPNACVDAYRGPQSEGGTCRLRFSACDAEQMRYVDVGFTCVRRGKADNLRRSTKFFFGTNSFRAIRSFAQRAEQGVGEGPPMESTGGGATFELDTKIAHCDECLSADEDVATAVDANKGGSNRIMQTAATKLELQRLGEKVRALMTEIGSKQGGANSTGERGGGEKGSEISEQVAGRKARGFTRGGVFAEKSKAFLQLVQGRIAKKKSEEWGLEYKAPQTLEANVEYLSARDLEAATKESVVDEY
eukprot:g19760.t1